MKKLVLAFAAIALSAAFFSCAKKEAEDAQVELTFVETMTSPTRTAQLEAIIADFEAANPDIKVMLISPPYEQADSKLTMMLNNNTPADIIEVRDHTVKQYVNNGKLLDLTQYLDEWEEKDDLLPVTMSCAKTVNNTPFMIPQFFYIKGLFVRTDILAEHGITKMPQTVSELYKICEQMTNPASSQYGFAFRGKGSSFKISDVLILSDVSDVSFGDIYKREDGSFSFDNADAKAALESYKRLYKNAAPNDALTWGFNEQVSGFISGTTPFLVQDPDTISMIAEQLSPDQYTVIPMPVGTSGKCYLDAGFAGLGIPSYSKHPKEAWRFISYILSEKVNSDFCQTHGPLPIHSSTYTTNDFFKSPLYQPWAVEMSQGNKYHIVNYPLDSPSYPSWSQVQEQSMQAFLMDKITVDELVEQWKEHWK